jgi:1,4-dihydroxy-2-naphthoyl-CoA synthase
MYKNVKLVKAKELLFKCTKWDQECISKFRNIVINVKAREKSLLKVQNANNVLEKRPLKKRK